MPLHFFLPVWLQGGNVLALSSPRPLSHQLVVQRLQEFQARDIGSEALSPIYPLAEFCSMHLFIL